MIKRAEFNISGLVQGVGFRYFVYRHAIELNLKGYAKNLFDGSVEVVVEGEFDNILLLAELLKRGPSHAQVHSCKVSYGEPRNKFTEFLVL